MTERIHKRPFGRWRWRRSGLSVSQMIALWSAEIYGPEDLWREVANRGLADVAARAQLSHVSLLEILTVVSGAEVRSPRSRLFRGHLLDLLLAFVAVFFASLLIADLWPNAFPLLGVQPVVISTAPIAAGAEVSGSNARQIWTRGAAHCFDTLPSTTLLAAKPLKAGAPICPADVLALQLTAVDSFPAGFRLAAANVKLQWTAFQADAARDAGEAVGRHLSNAVLGGRTISRRLLK